MIERVTPIQFDRKTTSGRTEPAFLSCERLNHETVEVVAKLSATCDRGVTSLAIEMLSACLAGDLGLPIEEPLFVELDAEWVHSIADDDWRQCAAASAPLAFGSRRAPNGFGQWIASSTMTSALTSVAASVLVFDCLVDNTDRRPSNPNCLQRGDEIRIIDHELCFPAILLGWRPPWELGSLNHIAASGVHIFRDALKGRQIDWTPIANSWKGLSDGQLEDYEALLPPEWAAAANVIPDAIAKVRNARDHIDDCIIEVRRVLT